MPDPTALDFAKHGKLRLKDDRNYSAFASMHLVPVVFQEFYALATEFPLVFVRNSKTGDLVPVAMMGLTAGRNLYCQESRWQPAFVPSSFTLAPFSVLSLDSGDGEPIMAIDEESSLLSEETGEPLFAVDGAYTPFLRKRIDHAANITRQSLQALEICRLLAKRRLLRSRPLRFRHGPQGPKYEVDGVFMIDEEALEKVGDEDFLELRRRCLLPLIYSHLTSLQQFGRLLRKQSESDAARVDS